MSTNTRAQAHRAAESVPYQQDVTDDDDSDDDEDSGESDASDSPSGSPSRLNGRSMSRTDEVRDIISAFSHTTLPEEFEPHQAANMDLERTPEVCVVQGEFEATMFRLAVIDENVYRAMNRTMPAGARAIIFFNKIMARCDSLLTEFDEYCQNGPIRDGRALEIPLVVKKLEVNLALIQKNIFVRSGEGIDDATEAVVKVLGNIANRNYDAFENNAWGRRTPRGETANDRNLFAQLICNDRSFALDCLKTLPGRILRQGALDAVFTKLQNNGASPAYLHRFGALMRGSGSAGGGSTTAGLSGQKRPATATKNGGGKRMK